VGELPSAPPADVVETPSDVLVHLCTEPALEHRRQRFTGQEVMLMVMMALARKGVSEEVLTGSTFVWRATATGEPELVMIKPGLRS
jgi:hypothetical protein